MSKRGITLMELLVAISLLSVIVLAMSSIQSFGHYHALTADRRAKLQNDLSFTLAHMAKNVQRAVGDEGISGANRAIQNIANGFKVRVDVNSFNPSIPPTFGNYNDDVWFNYELNVNTLQCRCVRVTGGNCPSPYTNAEVLSTKIVTGLNSNYPSTFTNDGFNFGLPDNGSTTVIVMLRGRYKPGDIESTDNPEVMMSNSLHTLSSAAK